MNRQNKIILTEGEVWDFAMKEVCKNLGCTNVEFVLSCLYKSFKRRVNYFTKTKHDANVALNEGEGK